MIKKCKFNNYKECNHCGDYMGYYGNDSAIIILGDKKWTTEEIFKEVKNVINKLIEIKE